ncbi:MAG: hypothetical protein CL947_00765 [Epsilonproteobacteria bacterium]|nr:hypothetical protein [Campylobacterota bacterium]
MVIIFLLSISQEVFNGFVAGTLVKVPDGYEAIENLVPGSIVYSFDAQGNIQISKVEKTFSYKSSRSIVFELENEIIIAASSQKYYILVSNSWQKAEKVSIATKLCSLLNEQINIQGIRQMQSEVELFDIQLENVHTFCITKQDIVVHNFPSFVIGLSFAFGGGISFEGIKAGLCIAGVWIGTKIFKRSSQKDKSEFDVQITTSCDFCIDKDDGNFYIQDAQAPGKPTEHDGFIPKKNWDGKKVRHRRGHGWPDEKGSIWIPTGPNRHGGPHWDVQHPDGTYDNIVPGGRIRGQK